MKNILILSTDLIRPDEIEKSFSIASLLCYLKSSPEYMKKFTVEHFSVNFYKSPLIQPEEIFCALNKKYQLNDFDFIFISCYVWSEYLINPLIKILRRANYRHIIGLGGYQINYSCHPEQEYPGCQIFIGGYGEASLLKAILQEYECPVILREPPIIETLPSPYISGEFVLKYGQPMVRMETMRGCPYKCSFCAHRDLSFNKVYLYPEDKVFEELLLFKRYNVQKINILDPIFNLGQRSVKILERIKQTGLQSLVSLQTRFENIKGATGKKFMDLCSQLNVHLEFGVQSIHAAEYNSVDRPNDVEQMARIIHELNEQHISYEVSLIYGLPNQTYNSFHQTIEYLHNQGCENIKAYPLMLLKGTKLYGQKERYGFREKVMGEYQIPVAVASNTFTEKEWYQMHEMASSLVMSGRCL